MITRIYSIAYGCPKNRRDDDCPFLEIVHFSFKEKIEWINGLNDEDKETILKHHSICTKKKIIK